MLVRPFDQNVPGRLGEASSAGYPCENAAQRSSKYQAE